MTIGPPIPPWKFKVKGTPVSAESSWLISLVFHIRASYWLLSLSFHDNQASHSQHPIRPWKFEVQGQGQRYPSQRRAVDSFPFCFTSIGPTIHGFWTGRAIVVFTLILSHSITHAVCYATWAVFINLAAPPPPPPPPPPLLPSNRDLKQGL